ncbi:MAG: hypothetical protein QOE70_4293 [Chthoniobacter sp.]|nr:hypothetical protein [Chthoniobacter sp.]
MEDDPAMRFVVASYGTKHVGMLLTHLHSIARSHPEARAAVYWQDIPAPLIDAIRAAFPSFDFPRTEFEFHGDWIKRISNKVRAWNRAAAEYASEPALCLLDVDTLVHRDLAPFFSRNDAEVIFTWKPERTPLNTGVMLARGGEPVCAFLREWEKRTLEILETPELYAQANDFSRGYGGTDQMSFFQMIGYEPGRTTYEIELAGHRVRFRGEPCALLNETNSRPITAHTHVIHYKGGWQPILIEGRRFTRNRPRAASAEMYALYLESFMAALRRVNDATGGSWTPRDFNLHAPAWHRQTSAGARALLYSLHVARDYVRSAGEMMGHAVRLAARQWHAPHQSAK